MYSGFGFCFCSGRIFDLFVTLARLDGVFTLSKIDCVLDDMVPVLLCNSDFKLESSLLMRDNASVLDCCSCFFWLEMAVRRSFRFLNLFSILSDSSLIHVTIFWVLSHKVVICNFRQWAVLGNSRQLAQTHAPTSPIFFIPTHFG